jgi:4-amino-4-deoxy-L-arabinose transferase-like glycosyltransferase
VALFHLCFRRRAPGGWISHLLGAAIFIAVALPWPLAVMHSVPNATELWRYESVGELSGENLEGTQPWYFYTSILYLVMPWTPAWVLSLIWPFWRKRLQAFFPFAWCVLLIVVFSFVGQKKPPYLLPIMPAAALMIAIALAPTLRLASRWRMKHWPGAVVLGQTVIGVGSAAALVGFVWQHRQTRWAGLFLLSIALVLALIALAHMLAVRPRRWFAAQVAAYAAVLLVFYHFHETPTNNERSPKALCAELAPLIDGTHRALLVSKLPEEVAFYLPLHPPEGPAPSRYVVVIDDQKGVRERARRNSTEVPSPAPQEFQGWFADAKVIGVRRVPMSAAPGDARYKVYELTVSRSGLALR